MHNSGQGRPKIAIIDPNTLSVLGLKHILQNVIPIMTVDSYGSFAEFMANKPEDYFHYFTAMNIVLENKAFFDEHKRKTIVLTLSLDPMSQLSDFHCLCINMPEKEAGARYPDAPATRPRTWGAYAADARDPEAEDTQ